MPSFLYQAQSLLWKWLYSSKRVPEAEVLGDSCRKAEQADSLAKGTTTVTCWRRLTSEPRGLLAIEPHRVTEPSLHFCQGCYKWRSGRCQKGGIPARLSLQHQLLGPHTAANLTLRQAIGLELLVSRGYEAWQRSPQSAGCNVCKGGNCLQLKDCCLMFALHALWQNCVLMLEG